MEWMTWRDLVFFTVGLLIGVCIALAITLGGLFAVVRMQLEDHKTMLKQAPLDRTKQF